MVKETIIVTGAAGFIGASLVNELHNSSLQVVAVVGPDSDLHRLNKSNNVIIERANLVDYSQVSQLITRHTPTQIVHLASHGVYTRQKADVPEILVGNYEMSFNMLDCAFKTGAVKKFINAGSVFEYGTRSGQVGETDISLTDILNDYSASKLATTALAASYYDRLPLITLRFFTAYGPYEDESRFIRASVIRALRNEDLAVVPEVVRDFIYIQDIVDAIKVSLDSKVQSEVINIGSGERYTLEDIARLIIRITKSNSKIVLNNDYMRAKDSRCWSDISKAAELLKWKPQYSIAKGLGETVKWCAANNLEK